MKTRISIFFIALGLMALKPFSHSYGMLALEATGCMEGMTDIEKQLAQLDKQRSELVNDIDKLKVALNKARGDMQPLDAKKKTLIGDIGVLNQEIAFLLGIDPRSRDQEKALETKSKLRDKKQAELDALQKKIDDLNNRIKDLIADIKNKSNELNKLDRLRRDLQQQIDQMKKPCEQESPF